MNTLIQGLVIACFYWTNGRVDPEAHRARLDAVWLPNVRNNESFYCSLVSVAATGLVAWC